MDVAVTAFVLRGDAGSLPFADASVDLIVTSPPYWSLRDYRDGDASLEGQIGNEPSPQEYIANLLRCTREWARVLKPSGSIFVNLGDKYANRTRGAWRGSSDGHTWRGHSPRYVRPKDFPEKSLLLLPERYRIAAMDELGLIVREVLIWSKPTPLPESVTDRCQRSHEDWVHLTKSQRYFSAIDDIREPHSPDSLRRSKSGSRHMKARNANLTRTGTGDYDGPNPLGKLPPSVWEIAAQPLRVPDELAMEHDAAFPMEWPRRLTLGWSPPGGLVVDPFGGTGTTALVASALGRRGVTIDRSAGYCRIAQWRTSDRGERARALGLPKPPPEPKGHPTLFDEVAS